jgi:DNA-binding NarL/FixJ family response regulator
LQYGFIDDFPFGEAMTISTVAIVEDDPAIRYSLRRWIDAAPGFRCVCACASTASALARISRRRPDFVLIEIRLPQASGVARAVRLQQLMPALPVVMMTFYHDQGFSLRSLRGAAPTLAEQDALKDALSRRELDILACLSEGLANKEIGARLGISYDTVRAHLRRIYEKLHVHSRAGAVSRYFQRCA